MEVRKRRSRSLDEEGQEEKMKKIHVEEKPNNEERPLEDQKKSPMEKTSKDKSKERKKSEDQLEDGKKSPMEKRSIENGANKRMRSEEGQLEDGKESLRKISEDEKKSPMEKRSIENGANKRRRSEKGQLEDGKKISEDQNKRSRSPEDPLEGGSKPKKLRVDTDRPAPLDIKNYRFYSELASGGFGQVMLASYAPTKQLVAVKIMKKKPDKSNFAIMMKEARLLKVARGCTFLCHSYAAFQSELEAFLILEYASGKSLMEMINRKGNLPMGRIMFYTAEMVVGLQFLHSKGIVHRDVKPDNTLVDRDGHIKICDFGLAAEGIFDEERTSGVAGTPGYRAPEVLLKANYNAGVDWWSFGITMYQMATGRLPFSPTGSIVRQYYAIEKNKPNYPYYMSQEMLDLLPKLLEMKENKRIGVNGNIREHSFYRTVIWEELENRRVKSPFQPGMPSADDFTECQQTFSANVRKEETNLEDFSYVDPNWEGQG
ncbi:hypothetical protein XENTR_v10005117 [Xenopus tropicalis]|uniref:Protein kinase C theta type-like n=1 Tax=Xenopus tropicalis TaxID=8364 RepID=A0A803JCI0_XENTR|nr:protein kinase C theta type-like [Xenopus tropicalis]KAE8622152.1 hypothetical protein XENTR_v10005117 [Xenopus tropicalis]